MLKFLKLIYGYVIILVRGENLERFLNLCKSRKVYMEKIRYREDGQLMAQMQAADFFRLRPLRNKTGVHIPVSYTHLDVYKRQTWSRYRR